MREMSCINDLTSRAGVLLDRSWLSLASRHGCWETWTLGGRSAMAAGVGLLGMSRRVLAVEEVVVAMVVR